MRAGQLRTAGPPGCRWRTNRTGRAGHHTRRAAAGYIKNHSCQRKPDKRYRPKIPQILPTTGQRLHRSALLASPQSTGHSPKHRRVHRHQRHGRPQRKRQAVRGVLLPHRPGRPARRAKQRPRPDHLASPVQDLGQHGRRTLGSETPARSQSAGADGRGYSTGRPTRAEPALPGGSMPFCVELDNLKDTDAPIHQPAAMLVAAD